MKHEKGINLFSIEDRIRETRLAFNSHSRLFTSKGETFEGTTESLKTIVVRDDVQL